MAEPRDSGVWRVWRIGDGAGGGRVAGDRSAGVGPGRRYVRRVDVRGRRRGRRLLDHDLRADGPAVLEPASHRRRSSCCRASCWGCRLRCWYRCSRRCGGRTSRRPTSCGNTASNCACAVIVAVGAKLLFESAVFAELDRRQFTPLKRSAVLLSDNLGSTTMLRYFFGIVGGLRQRHRRARAGAARARRRPRRRGDRPGQHVHRHRRGGRAGRRDAGPRRRRPATPTCIDPARSTAAHRRTDRDHARSTSTARSRADGAARGRRRAGTARAASRTPPRRRARASNGRRAGALRRRRRPPASTPARTSAPTATPAPCSPTTDDVAHDVSAAPQLRQRRSKYHHPEIGFNSRLDTLQAVVPAAKLRRLAGWNDAAASRRRALRRAARRIDGGRLPPRPPRQRARLAPLRRPGPEPRRGARPAQRRRHRRRHPLPGADPPPAAFATSATGRATSRSPRRRPARSSRCRCTRTSPASSRSGSCRSSSPRSSAADAVTSTERVRPRARASARATRSVPRTRVWAFAHVMTGAIVGADCNLGDHAFVEGGARLGDRGDGQERRAGLGRRHRRGRRLPRPEHGLHQRHEPAGRLQEDGRTVPPHAGSARRARSAPTPPSSAGSPSASTPSSAPARSSSATSPPRAGGRQSGAASIGWICACGERLPDGLDCSSCGRRFELDEDGLIE